VNVGKTGFLFKNTVDLIDILNQLIENPPLSRNIAKAARQYVTQERLQSQHVQERIDFYKDQYEKLQRQGWQNNGRLEWFEGLSRLDGAVINERHIRLQSTRFENLLHDGLVAMQVTNDRKLANRLFEEAAALEPENYLPFLFGSPVSSDPVNTLNRAIELEPDSLKSWLLLGEEFERTGKIKEALESFESAVKICPEYEIPYLRVAVLLKKLGEQSQSDWFLRKAEELEIYQPLPSN
jgi:tetratricopeptide (TPR) repeat protein